MRVWIPLAASALVFAVPAAAGGEAAGAGPVSKLASHGETIRPALIGSCPIDQPPGGNRCAYPAVFKSTRPIPVHSGVRVVVTTDHPASAVRLYLCGRARPAERRSPRRWIVRAPHRVGAGCKYNDMSVDYTRGPWAGERAVYTFSGRVHRH